ncbi:hypothetical protein GLOIN_2v1590374 [Rhizophagus irregularis DAOM 181602=DAOM 197198]|uniref:Uncharacterized protein n=1 Tax=Rhizophagus irregularis (strain DAOM 181602 / DAOM 197198 / MUCL 43194) TaxID=747089 RepID=A0A2P4Q617_RHIID|nr:hypothetical protein GLOIN_2v1590374 [Rhizophagus irregularis DAOM 181602=DAOM 197198]POG73064.1 hypothetical protein GLOIN_2v1590374 [Rhizophagus irregularis DAOM 181602=DAOM 197198]GET50656.1 hypothetical protein GLOIN_2v1590374 [Rhizophagus irregularis DAOM 181602=DAOM 197198]|eukprot:XP_025179930.1 hypothetical protein GLOIN_2v1590374 [Rhizophagus irregularis DAOM 181602=DAOM 197198]
MHICLYNLYLKNESYLNYCDIVITVIILSKNSVRYRQCGSLFLILPISNLSNFRPSGKCYLLCTVGKVWI